MKKILGLVTLLLMTAHTQASQTKMDPLHIWAVCPQALVNSLCSDQTIITSDKILKQEIAAGTQLDQSQGLDNRVPTSNTQRAINNRTVQLIQLSLTHINHFEKTANKADLEDIDLCKANLNAQLEYCNSVLKP